MVTWDTVAVGALLLIGSVFLLAWLHRATSSLLAGAGLSSLRAATVRGGLVVSYASSPSWAFFF